MSHNLDFRDSDKDPLLNRNSGTSSSKEEPKRKHRRKSILNTNFSEDNHEIFGSDQGRFGTDTDNVDPWGIIHDIDDESTIDVNGGRIESGKIESSFIDHRPSIELLGASNGNSGCVGMPPRRPRTVPKNITSEMSNISNSYYQQDSLVQPSFGVFTHPQGSISSNKSENFRGNNPRSLKYGFHQAKSSWYSDKGYGSVLASPRGVGHRQHLGQKDNIDIKVDEFRNHGKQKREQDQCSTLDSNVGSDNYNSQPSLRRSNDTSSLDDVCLPIDEADLGGLKKWPDIGVIEEFSREEVKRLKKEALQDAEGFHFQYDSEDDNGTAESGNGIAFLKPIINDIDVPELGNTRINETEQLRKGRLRPKKLTPWHLKRERINLPGLTDSITASKNAYKDMVRGDHLIESNLQYSSRIVSNNPEVFRFTYFREDLDSTIHSPTISGLLQPGQKFDELFVGSVYLTLNKPKGSSNENLNKESAHKLNTTTTAASCSNPDVHAAMDTKASTSPLPVNTTQHSSSCDLTDVVPFWLDVLNPSEEEMKVLSKTFGIHPLTTEDIFLGEVREKVELFKDYYLVCFRSFDIVAEQSIRKKKQIQESINSGGNQCSELEDIKYGWLSRFRKSRLKSFNANNPANSISSYQKRLKRELQLEKKRNKKSGKRKRSREGELEPLNVYIIVFRTGVLTFHFASTPHLINVRRRARLLKDYVNVTADWIAYALIDDITDAFAPLIELIEDEVYDIEDSILEMHHADNSSDSSDYDLDDSSDENLSFPFDRVSRRTILTNGSRTSTSTHSSSRSESTLNAKIMGWKKKGDMLRRIGECRKRVMSIVRLLGSKADVIKGFSKRCNEQWEVAPRSEIAMYLGDIQDHIITMVSSLNHYEKLLSRSHSNYLAQINIDMTKVNNDMNDVLGKITILGTIVMPVNVITGLWGMNVIVPGQRTDSLQWFLSIALSMVVLAYVAYTYTRRRFGF